MGQGTFGKVYEVVRMGTQEKQALKVVQQVSEHAVKEAKILNNMSSHPNVIQLIEWTRSKNQLYLFMQHGGSRNLLQEQRLQTGQRFETELAISLFMDVWYAIVHIHQCGVCHLDIKQENVLVADDDRGTLRLTDFGTAAYIDQPLERAAGSFPFVAPEVLDMMVKGKRVKYYGDCADCFSMGVLLFEMCFGVNSMSKQLGWKGRSFASLMNDAPNCAAQLRSVLSDRRTLCKTMLLDTSSEMECQQVLLHGLSEMLNPDASTRSSVMNISMYPYY
jgi:serine/threonine protein kinase